MNELFANLPDGFEDASKRRLTEVAKAQDRLNAVVPAITQDLDALLAELRQGMQDCERGEIPALVSAYLSVVNMRVDIEKARLA
mgnify:CR=1 FL=1